MSTAEARGWGKGWPTDRRSDMTRVSDGNDVKIYVHKQIGTLVAGLMSMTERMGYRINGAGPPPCHPAHPQGETWGYANRAIRGTKTASNHSWGLAIDINAPSNPMTSKLVTNIPPAVVQMWKRFGFRWGGDYTGRKDAMHFEYMGTPRTAVQDTEKFLREFGAILGKPPSVITPPPPSHGTIDFKERIKSLPVLKKGSKGQHVRNLQGLLRAHGNNIEIDGDFGNATHNVLKAWQKRAGLADVDGIAGDQTWAHLIGV